MGVVQGHSKWYHSNFESMGTVSYSHSIAIMAVSLAVSTQCTNVTEEQTPHDGIQAVLTQRIARQKQFACVTARDHVRTRRVDRTLIQVYSVYICSKRISK